MHGYDYKYLQVPEIKGLTNTWVKVKEIYRLVKSKEYDFVVFTDADVVFPDLRLPLEPLFSHWNITKDIALAAALDNEGTKLRHSDWNDDTHGRTNINTGFIIAQDTPAFDELMRAWMDCPTNVRYPNCSIWSHKRFHEQSALSSYIRYDYPDSIREIPYLDANSKKGKFIKHYWFDKKSLPSIVRATIADRFMPDALASLTRDWSRHSAFTQQHPLPGLEALANSTFTEEENASHPIHAALPDQALAEAMGSPNSQWARNMAWYAIRSVAEGDPLRQLEMLAGLKIVRSC